VQLLATLARSAEEREVPEAASDRSLDETEDKVFSEILKRIEAARKGETDETVTK